MKTEYVSEWTGQEIKPHGEVLGYMFLPYQAPPLEIEDMQKQMEEFYRVVHRKTLWQRVKAFFGIK